MHMEGDTVRVLAPWSQKHNQIGKVIEERKDEVVVNFGDPQISFALPKEEVEIIVETKKLVSSHKRRAS